MIFEVLPYQSAGPFSFGVLREVSRKYLTEEVDLVLMKEGKLPLDKYEKTGVIAVYDKYDKLACLEFTQPAQVVYKSKDLLRMNWKSLLAFLQQEDPELEETTKECISWKLGISAFAPDKDQNPFMLPVSITVFKKDFFDVKNGIADPDDRNTFHLQTAFVESIRKMDETVPGLQEGFGKIFSNNLENGMLLWNGIPVKFNYRQDLPAFLEAIIQFLDKIQRTQTGSTPVVLNCISFSVTWKAQWDREAIVIHSDWKHIEGDYENALQKHSTLTVLKSDFMAEWKKLLEQCLQSYSLSAIRFSDETAMENLKRMKQLEKSIPVYGKFYHTPKSVLHRDATGRYAVNFFRLPAWQRNLIGIVIIGTVFGLLWISSKNDGFPVLSLERFLTVLMYTAAISIPLTFLAYLYLRKRARR